MLTYCNINELYNLMINYIENNKRFNEIKYSESINCIEELVKELKEEYRSIENEK